MNSLFNDLIINLLQLTLENLRFSYCESRNRDEITII